MCEPGLHKHNRKDGYCAGAVHLSGIKDGGLRTRNWIDEASTLASLTSSVELPETFLPSIFFLSLLYLFLKYWNSLQASSPKMFSTTNTNTWVWGYDDFCGGSYQFSFNKNNYISIDYGTFTTGQRN